ncbi:putative Integrase-type DNA-binding superfamily protein [Tripterygium wilfordii]|uniref:Putative Integrase-type DNA-binding superfamily protein n=1 Tax=Tripterygium wilfordii TaxID=458696 RepID=A0A7J7D842_TRIWF|nr:ethylene-responsive transcription factor WRI1-like [Tripterygium wilfordii]KAF5742484.1 putative Integrase-type DNA-binding superfamily protein [Tripterygium wilfordii]
MSPPTTSSSSSSTSSSSLSYVVGSEIHDSDQPKSTKRPRKKTQDQNQHSKNANSSPNSGSKRSSIYRGVTRHRLTGRFEAHLWDKSSWNNIQNKKGKQVYLGAYDNEESAAGTCDLAALKYWGPDTTLNFQIDNYRKEIEEMQKVSKKEYLASLRRRSSGFSRGVSKYRGVAKHHHNGRWEARIGRVFGNKYVYLGTYNTQEEAAAAYDMAALEYRGANAVTNFDFSNYIEKLKQKGIHIVLDHLQEPVANCSSESEEAEAEQLPQQQQEQREIASSEPQAITLQDCSCEENFAMVPLMDSDELTWSFCMEPGFTPLPVPEFPLETLGEFASLFDESIGFEDNILDLIFDRNGDEANPGCVVDNDDKERLSSSSSSSTTSVFS